MLPRISPDYWLKAGVVIIYRAPDILACLAFKTLAGSECDFSSSLLPGEEVTEVHKQAKKWSGRKLTVFLLATEKVRRL